MIPAFSGISCRVNQYGPVLKRVVSQFSSLKSGLFHPNSTPSVSGSSMYFTCRISGPIFLFEGGHVKSPQLLLRVGITENCQSLEIAFSLHSTELDSYVLFF